MNPNNKGHERRRFTRIIFDATATITDNKSEWQSEVIDISLKGIMLKRPENWKQTTQQRFYITVHLNDNTNILMQTRVAHTCKSSIGFVCEEIDIESIAHLRRLIELNTKEENLIYRELECLRQY